MGNEVLNRKTEGKNIVALSKNKKLQKILPRYYAYILQERNILAPQSKEVFNVPDGTMVSEYLAGKEFNIAMFRKKQYQQALARMLHTFHTSGVRFVNPYNVFRNEIKKYRVAAKKFSLTQFISPDRIAFLEQIEKEAEKKLLLFKKGISTHNDFIFQNFLVGKDEKIYLLDFEYAGLNKQGGIFYDLGYVFRDGFFQSFRISRELFERFLCAADKIYGRKINRAQIYWSVIAALLVGIWWGILRYFSASRTERAYFRTYIQRGVQGVLEVYLGIKKE